MPSQSLPKFSATVGDNSLLACTNSTYRIADVYMFGLLCPLINGTTTADLKATSIVLNQLQFPFKFGTGLPRSSISVIDASGNLRGFGYLNSQNRAAPSSFAFKSVSPRIIMELQKGLELTFTCTMTHQLPANFIFEIGASDATDDPSFYFNPVTISNGCILNSDISIGSVLTITSTRIKCAFANSADIPVGDSLTILVLSVSVL